MFCIAVHTYTDLGIPYVMLGKCRAYICVFCLVIKIFSDHERDCRHNIISIIDSGSSVTVAILFCRVMAKRLTGEVWIRALILFTAVRACSAPSRLRGSVEIRETRRRYTSYLSETAKSESYY